jgi:hypothetical protein
MSTLQMCTIQYAVRGISRGKRRLLSWHEGGRVEVHYGSRS